MDDETDAASARADRRDGDTTLLLIEQEELAPPGHIVDWLASRRIPYRRVRASAGELASDPARFAGIIALGSQQSAYDDHVPWVREELELLGRAVDMSVPVLGICFGGQALAAALGASVRRARRGEIGWVSVGSRRPEVVADGPWFTWHDDEFALPEGATEVAHNGQAIQAFAHGSHLGLQFHPEVTPEIVRGWLSLAEREGAIRDAGREWARTGDLYPAARGRAFELFDAWYGGRQASPGS